MSTESGANVGPWLSMGIAGSLSQAICPILSANSSLSK